MKRKKTKKKAFSLIEAMVSIFMISIGMITVLSLVSVGLRDSMDTRNQTIAALLAQEGIELVRNIRDTNWIQENETFQDISNGTFRMDINDSALDSSSSFDLYYSSGYYVHEGGSSTHFRRKIIISGDTSQKVITSVVVWSGADFPSNASLNSCNSTTKCAYTEVTLYDWSQ